jgi:hypothetical protein
MSNFMTKERAQHLFEYWYCLKDGTPLEDCLTRQEFAYVGVVWDGLVSSWKAKNPGVRGDSPITWMDAFFAIKYGHFAREFCLRCSNLVHTPAIGADNICKVCEAKDSEACKLKARLLVRRLRR